MVLQYCLFPFDDDKLVLTCQYNDLLFYTQEWRHAVFVDDNISSCLQILPVNIVTLTLQDKKSTPRCCCIYIPAVCRKGR